MFSRFIYYSLFCLVSYNAYAGSPSLYNKCTFGNISHPKNSSAVAFDEECLNAYVLPPNIGIAKVTAVQQSQNLGLCPALKTNLVSLGESTKTRLILLKKINKMLEEYKPLQLQRDKLYAVVSKNKALFDSASEKLNNNKVKEKKLLDRITETKTSYDRLVTISAANSEINLARDFYEKSLVEYKTFITGDLFKSENDYYFVKKEYLRYNEDYSYFDSKYAESIKPLLDLQKMVDDLERTSLESYKKYVSLEGLTAQILFNVDSTNILKGYKSLNKNLNLTWQVMPMKDAFFSASVKLADNSADSTATALIDSVIPGIKSQSIKDLDSNQITPSLNEGQVTAPYPFGSVSGKVRLNLNGACVYFDNVNKSVAGTDVNNITANLSLNVNYTYQVKVRRSFTAKYNLYNMLSRIEKQSTKGGWIKTSSLHSVVEDKNSGDWFHIKFDGDSSAFQYTPQEQDEITKQEKALLVDRALKQFAAINSGTPQPAPALVTPPESGFMYASKQLRYCPHFYCQVGSFVLGTLSSIFGSSTAVSEFKNKTNVWAIDQIDGYQIIDRSGSLTFSSKL
nr:hypothetical protein GTC16762_05700 [Pigmentibacter ruber]